MSYEEDLVQKFLSCFSLLREACDSDPSNILQQATADKGLAKIGLAVFSAYRNIIDHEEHWNRITFDGYSTNYIKSRRLFEREYLLSCAFCGLLIEAENPDTGDEEFQRKKKAYASFGGDALVRMSKWLFETRLDWNEAQKKGFKTGSDIDFALSTIDVLAALAPKIEKQLREFENEFYGDQADPDLYIVDRLDAVENGRRELDNLFDEDFSALSRRKLLTPKVMIPPHVFNRSQNTKKKASLLRLLREAQIAFIFGAPLAAISLLRSLLEVLLKEHYLCIGGDLLALINDSHNKIPKSVYPKQLHELRMLANKVLHAGTTEENHNENESPRELEQSVAKHLDTLRELIEALQ